MSRETDSSSSGPQGRGGAAYPSGTPPYGSRQYPSPHPSQDGPEGAAEPAEPPRPDEPRTETTLTTRIRINIPGSRPIPPVVMRTPMSDADGGPDGERTGGSPRPGASAPAGAGGAEPREEPEEPAAERPAREKSGSDWFAPRKTPTTTSVAGGGGAGEGPEGATPPGTPPRADTPFFPDGPRADTGRDFPDGPRPDAGRSGTPRPGGMGSGRDAFGDGTPPAGSRPAPDPGVRTPGPSGPTTGPATGASPLTPNLDGPGGSGPMRPGGPGRPQDGGPGGAPPRLSDDTAVLTPQFPPGPGAGGPGPGGNVSGDTLTSGIPVVPPEARSASPFPGGGGPRPDLSSRPADRPPGTGPAGTGGPAPQASAPRPTPKSVPARKKGRSKVVLLGAGALCLLGVAYGAGLLMNHSDVPKGTTVLGVDIGGGTKDQGVQKLETSLGKRAQAPLQLSVDGRRTSLAPDKAGLSLDSQETVRSAAGSDYNPVSVIGSLFGGARTVDPVIPVDEEKLGVALTDLAGVSASANDGTIKFEPGKAVAVPGKPGKTLDVNQSMISVRDAYRAQVQTGKADVVKLPVATTAPTISQAELDRAMKEFAKPAMSGLVTIKAGAKQIQFGPAKSLPQILSMVPVKGRLVEHYDKKAIDTLCEGVFDGIMVTKGDGTKHQLDADDVAHAMQTALLGSTQAERTATIDLAGNG